MSLSSSVNSQGEPSWITGTGSVPILRCLAARCSGSALGGFGSLALTALLAEESRAAAARSREPAGTAAAAFPRASAKRVIFLFMKGGPSHVDTFDYKPKLQRDHGKPLPFAKPRVQFAKTGKLLGSPWKFAPVRPERDRRQRAVPPRGRLRRRPLHPQLDARDQLAPTAERCSSCTPAATTSSGRAWGRGSPTAWGPRTRTCPVSSRSARPWRTAACELELGVPARRLPGNAAGQRRASRPSRPGSASSTTPAFRRDVAAAAARHARGAEPRPPASRPGRTTALEGRLASFELAFRMQTEMPAIEDLPGESPATLRGNTASTTRSPRTSAASACWPAGSPSGACGSSRSRTATRSCSGTSTATSRKGTTKNAREVDRPIAGLLKDLKARGLLEDTLVLWGGEFGRTPTAEGDNGRDHNPEGFTMWLAGGGVKPGFQYGTTDEYGYYAVENKVHIHDLHATLLHLLGLDHEKLTYRYAGRDFRLTDVAGQVAHDIMA